jgi:hypothetical protein
MAGRPRPSGLAHQVWPRKRDDIRAGLGPNSVGRGAILMPLPLIGLWTLGHLGVRALKTAGHRPRCLSEAPPLAAVRAARLRPTAPEGRLRWALLDPVQAAAPSRVERSSGPGRRKQIQIFFNSATMIPISSAAVRSPTPMAHPAAMAERLTRLVTTFTRPTADAVTSPTRMLSALRPHHLSSVERIV